MQTLFSLFRSQDNYHNNNDNNIHNNNHNNNDNKNDNNNDNKNDNNYLKIYHNNNNDSRGNKRDVNFELGKEMEEDVFRLVTSVGQKKILRAKRHLPQ